MKVEPHDYIEREVRDTAQATSPSKEQHFNVGTKNTTAKASAKPQTSEIETPTTSQNEGRSQQHHPPQLRHQLN